MPKEIYNSEPISLPEVRNLLLQRAKEGEELSYMQRIALEHAQLVARISSDDAKLLIDLLREKFRISEQGLITLVNFMPDTIDEIRQLLGKDAITMETETLYVILEELLKVERLDEAKKKSELEELDAEDDDDDELEDEKEIDESMIPEDLL